MAINKNLKKIIDILKSEKIVSLISDAGTPTVSDPGNILINECINNKINLISIPGPSALIAAFSVSGFSEKFYFYGFFPENNSEIKVYVRADKSLSYGKVMNVMSEIYKSGVTKAALVTIPEGNM